MIIFHTGKLHSCKVYRKPKVFKLYSLLKKAVNVDKTNFEYLLKIAKVYANVNNQEKTGFKNANDVSLKYRMMLMLVKVIQQYFAKGFSILLRNFKQRYFFSNPHVFFKLVYLNPLF